MKNRLLALLFACALLLSTGAQAWNTPPAREMSAFPLAVGEDDGGALLPRVRTYQGEFPDVSPDSWYYSYVVAGYEYGLFSGRENGFAPAAEITVAELLALSARLRAAYASEMISPSPTTPGEAWYAPYASYLRSHGLLDNSILSYEPPATRAQLAAIFAPSLPEECYDGLNAALVTRAVASGRYITDVNAYTPHRQQILWMYSQGLLSGTDERGSYRPALTTTRAEAAAVVMRMVLPSLRIRLDWPAWVSAAGRTLASLIEAPSGSLTSAPDPLDPGAVDLQIRKMLAAGESLISLDYGRPITQSDAQTLARVFSSQVKVYCEQMYNSVDCQYYINSGLVTLRFRATACAGEELESRRAETMARAVEVHDALWQSGQLRADMSQYEIAKVYYQWLCENCEYDRYGTVESSPSHLAWSALTQGRAVCDGYTGAYNLFLKLEGIGCAAQANDTHIWTVAVLDGVTYHIDVTWGDQEWGVDWDSFGMTPERSAEVHGK